MAMITETGLRLLPLYIQPHKMFAKESDSKKSNGMSRDDYDSAINRLEKTLPDLKENGVVIILKLVKHIALSDPYI